MPIKKLQQITSWSYSRLTTYILCPFKAKLTILDRMKEPENAYTSGGQNAHDDCESYLKNPKAPLTKAMARFPEEFAKLRKKKAVAEQTWAFRRDWSRTVYNDWDGCWLRIKTDAHYVEQSGKKTTVVVIDYKTGKEYEDHALQRSLYALGAFMIYPDATDVVVWHWYLDAGVERDSKFTRKKDAARLKKDWEARADRMLSDTIFPATPNPKCCWCHFRKTNGGPCQFS